jgi:hypothetical protein
VTRLDALCTLTTVQRYALNMAREEKPSGDWPSWAVEMDEQLTAIARELRREVKEAMRCA